MLVRVDSKNRIALPKAILSAYPGAEYFNVTDENGRIVLVPAHLNRADAVRSKLADLGISEKDVAEAISWARSKFSPRPEKKGN